MVRQASQFCRTTQAESEWVPLYAIPCVGTHSVHG